jgi:hypothetical protein
MLIRVTLQVPYLDAALFNPLASTSSHLAGCYTNKDRWRIFNRYNLTNRYSDLKR